ncbi:helix-turn-helix domain-containing protein [Clostridium butyricum]|jgi:transcriptional regulator with XRE-family HTH domain|uniref:Helix-turn-helix domain-containing protein n=1 Tax=Clostridium butyricum TaxID=1492 RepID=A0A6L9ESH9_CLOBU|nr:helix-turn-helix domain-containing protein [Clostridium butyricum]
MNTINIGEKLKRLREQQGLTQKQLAEKVGISVSNITKYEKGQLEPSIERLISLSEALNTSISNILTNSSNSDTDELLSSFKTNDFNKHNIDALTECIILAVINKYNLDINPKKLTSKNRSLIFNLASSTTKTFLESLLKK